jgi:hypothetical protein
MKDSTGSPGNACWLCRGLGGIAIHLKWSAERGEGKLPLWTAHEFPSGDPHPVEPCPACALSSLAVSRGGGKDVFGAWVEDKMKALTAREGPS